MSRVGTLAVIAAGLVVVLACAPGVGAAGGPAGAEASSLKAAGGIVIRYPRDWRAAAARDGMVVTLVGPARGGVRPAATFLVARGQGTMGELLHSAASGLGKQAPTRLLGERHLSPSQWARYYVRGEEATEEYVMIGVAQGGGWIVTMVGVDAASDPLLQIRAGVLQGLLVDIVFPTNRGQYFGRPLSIPEIRLPSCEQSHCPASI